ncbi:MAG: PRC-barrel domain-containing protein [Thermosynechococcaceae cyanobacterium]
MLTQTQLHQRSALIGIPIFRRSDTQRLGVINQLWVNSDQRRVCFIGIRKHLLLGPQHFTPLQSVDFEGETAWVDGPMLTQLPVDFYTTIVGSEVITETGELLGNCRSFEFDLATGEIDALVIDALGLPLIPAQCSSTYELSAHEIASAGPTRMIVFEGTELRLMQLTVGFRERMGLYTPPWDAPETENYIPTTWRTSNQMILNEERADAIRQLEDGDDRSAQSITIQEDDVWANDFWNDDDDDPDGPASSAVPCPRKPSPTPNDTAEMPPVD